MYPKGSQKRKMGSAMIEMQAMGNMHVGSMTLPVQVMGSVLGLAGRRMLRLRSLQPGQFNGAMLVMGQQSGMALDMSPSADGAVRLEVMGVSLIGSDEMLIALKSPFAVVANGQEVAPNGDMSSVSMTEMGRCQPGR